MNVINLNGPLKTTYLCKSIIVQFKYKISSQIINVSEVNLFYYKGLSKNAENLKDRVLQVKI